jgi:hypothetical protein
MSGCCRNQHARSNLDHWISLQSPTVFIVLRTRALHFYWILIQVRFPGETTPGMNEVMRCPDTCDQEGIPCPNVSFGL